MIREYDDLMVLIDKVRLAHQKHRNTVRHDGEDVAIEQAERIINKLLKGVNNGGSDA